MEANNSKGVDVEVKAQGRDGRCATVVGPWKDFSALNALKVKLTNIYKVGYSQYRHLSGFTSLRPLP